MTKQKVSVEEAALLLGISPNNIRYSMRKNELPIGSVRKSRSGKSFRYDIYKSLVLKYVGLNEWPKEGGQA